MDDLTKNMQETFIKQLEDLESKFHENNKQLPKDKQNVLNEVMQRAKNNDITPLEVSKLYETLI